MVQCQITNVKQPTDKHIIIKLFYITEINRTKITDDLEVMNVVNILGRFEY